MNFDAKRIFPDHFTDEQIDIGGLALDLTIAVGVSGSAYCLFSVCKKILLKSHDDLNEDTPAARENLETLALKLVVEILAKYQQETAEIDFEIVSPNASLH